MLTPAFVLSLHLLVGASFFFWSEPYRPQSRLVFDYCFQTSKLLWVVLVLIAAAIWPLTAASLLYRYFRGPKSDA